MGVLARCSRYGFGMRSLDDLRWWHHLDDGTWPDRVQQALYLWHQWLEGWQAIVRYHQHNDTEMDSGEVLLIAQILI